MVVGEGGGLGPEELAVEGEGAGVLGSGGHGASGVAGERVNLYDSLQWGKPNEVRNWLQKWVVVVSSCRREN